MKRISIPIVNENLSPLVFKVPASFGRGTRAKVHSPSPLALIPSLAWEKILIMFSGMENCIKGVSPEKRVTYLRGLMTEASSADEEDCLSAMCFACKLGESFLAKLKTPEICAYIGRMQRNAGDHSDGNILGVSSIAMDAIQECIHNPKDIHYYHEIMEDDSFSLKERQKAQACIDMIVMMITSPLPVETIRNCMRALFPESKKKSQEPVFDSEPVFVIDASFYDAQFAEAFRRAVCFANSLYLPAEKSDSDLFEKTPATQESVHFFNFLQNSIGDPEEPVKSGNSGTSLDP